MDDLADLPTQAAHQQQNAGTFHAAAGGAGTGPAQEQQNHDNLGKDGPSHIVCRGKAGGGDDGRNLEEGKAEALPDRVVNGVDVYAGKKDSQSGHTKEKAQLITVQYIFCPTAQQQEIHSEIDGEQQHEDGNDHFSRGVFIRTHAEIAVGKTTGTSGGKSMDKAVIQRQTGQFEKTNLHHSHHAIDGVQDLGGLGLLRHQLGKDRAGGLCLNEKMGAQAHGGQQRRGQHQNTHTTQPVGKGAPEKDPFGHGFDIGKNGCTGGGEAGVALKQAVDKGVELPAEMEGQRTKQSHKHPNQTYGKKAFPSEEMLFIGQAAKNKARK